MDGFNLEIIHQEDISNNAVINKNYDSITDGICNIDKEFMSIADNLKEMDEMINIRLASIKEKIRRTKEIQEDMNILCNKYTEFGSIMLIDDKIIEGNVAFNNNIFSLATTSEKKVSLKVNSVTGNGFDGNDFVIVDGEFANKILQVNNYNAMTDNAINSYFEYSRITTADPEAPEAFNRDSMEATCTIELYSENKINKIMINSDRDDITVNKILLSDDGKLYKEYEELNLKINNRDDRYSNQTYIYNKGIICFKESKYIKIKFSSAGFTNDNIGFIKTKYINGNTIENIINISSKSKRHCIKINDISGYKNMYTSGSFITKELVDAKIKSVAVIANEYIQKEYSAANSIKYFLIINGDEHEVVPLNSQRNGKKIIRMSSSSFGLENVKYIEEEISSLKLKVVMTAVNQTVTPYITDLKILVGD